MSQYNIGDKITLTDVGETYSTYSDFFIERGFCSEGFVEGRMPTVGEVYKIVGVGPHRSNGESVYVLKSDSGKQFLSGCKYFVKTRKESFKVGDVVTLSSKAGVYDLYSEFFEIYEIDPTGFMKGVTPELHADLMVKDVKPHPNIGKTIYVLEDASQRVFLASSSYMHYVRTAKFAVGDKIRVIEAGSGAAPSEVGVEVTVIELGLYRDEVGYRVDPLIGNTESFAKGLPRHYGGYIGESSFEPVRPHKDLIIAWANGADIQVYSAIKKDFVDVDQPRFKKTGQYRIKPSQEELDKELEIKEAEEEIAKLQSKLETLKGGVK